MVRVGLGLRALRYHSYLNSHRRTSERKRWGELVLVVCVVVV